MDFLEAVVDYLHDILYSDNVPVGYKQQAHKLLDQYKDETGSSLEYQASLKDWKMEIVTNTALGIIRISKQAYDEIESYMPTMRINAIKALRSDGIVKGPDGTIIQQIYGLKDAKDVIDQWSTWKKSKVPNK